MTDHKYTDEEVIRACECCTSRELSCKDCPAGDTPLCGISSELLLEIVQRQRAELKNAKAAAIKELVFALLGYVEDCEMIAKKRHKARGNGASRDYTVGKMYAYGKVVEFLRKYEVNDENIQETKDT